MQARNLLNVEKRQRSLHQQECSKEVPGWGVGGWAAVGSGEPFEVIALDLNIEK